MICLYTHNKSEQSGYSTYFYLLHTREDGFIPLPSPCLSLQFLIFFSDPGFLWCSGFAQFLHPILFRSCFITISQYYLHYILNICLVYIHIIQQIYRDIPSIYTPNTYPVLSAFFILLCFIQLGMHRVIRKIKCNCSYPRLHKHPLSTMI